MGHIFLYGPSGVGKSTVGQILAHHLNLPFTDSDHILETMAGMSIPQIMEEQGEAKLRELESAALKQITKEKEGVVALGGGALLREENRVLVENNGSVILLQAELPTLIERLQNDSHKRPLLAGDLELKLTSYLEKRVEHYDSFALKVEVDGKGTQQIAHQIQILLGQHHLSAMGEYDVIVQKNSLQRLGEMLQPRGLQNPVVVTDNIIASFHLEKLQNSLQVSGFESKSIVLPAGEDHKNLETVAHLWKSFLERGLDRNSTVIALGGGVIGDLAGFAASTYMRGIRWVAVPTSLLSMVDASLGGKTGFDLPEGKNLIGSFYPPKLVLADPQLLQTLPDRELRSGMAEVVKHGILSDPELFNLCSRGLDWVKANLEKIVKRAMAVKIKIIEEDPYERGFRAALNLGHTVGHAVELVSRFELTHGEAIAIGMVIEATYSERIGLAQQGLSEMIIKTLRELGLPVQIPRELSREEILSAMRVDKKKDSTVIRFALPVKIGQVELIEVADLENVLEEQ
jgi:shikimate kinase / 3-dehydroquinate synthase